MTGDLKPYPMMKDSSVPWLGEVPTHWIVLRGRRLFEIKKRIVGELGHPVISVTQEGLRAKDIGSGEGQLSENYSKYQIVKSGEFAMNSMDLLTGGVGIAASSGVTSPDYRVFAIRDESRCCDRYMLHVLRMLYRNRGFYAWGQGSAQLGRWRLPRKRFNDYPFPVPPLPEQSAIARFLDYMDQRIGCAIRAKQKLIALLNEQKQAIIHQAVTRGLDLYVRLKPSGIEWLGDVPEHWDEIRLKFLVRKITDGEHISPPLANEGVLLLSAKDIRDRTILYKVDKYVTPEHAEQFWRRCCPEQGDFLVVSRGATIGRVALVENDIPFCLMGSVILCKSKGDYAAEFLYYALNAYHAQTSLWFTSASSAQQAIYIRDVAELRLPIPPSSERDDIVRYLEESLGGIRDAVDRARREINLLREYRTRLIADVVTGKLDVREAASQLPEEVEEQEPLDEDSTVAEDDEEIGQADLNAALEEATA